MGKNCCQAKIHLIIIKDCGIKLKNRVFLPKGGKIYSFFSNKFQNPIVVFKIIDNELVEPPCDLPEETLIDEKNYVVPQLTPSGNLH